MRYAWIVCVFGIGLADTAWAADRDNDGVPDDKDGAPLEPEDKDGYEDEDGIPDPVQPSSDEAAAAGTSSAPAADHGAATGSGAAAPSAAATASAGPTGKPDIDKDTLIDAYDMCPSEAEDLDKFQDSDGCPDTDNDQDGLTDDKDPCPTQPGEECNKPAPLVINGMIAFAPGSPKIIVAKSKKALDQVLKLLQDNAVKKLEVQGHTDSGGKPEKNLELSQKRAQAVVDFLVGKGAAIDRLVAKGFGDSQPLKPNTTPQNRAANRRVEFYPVQE